jgi:hypothetical protein
MTETDMREAVKELGIEVEVEKIEDADIRRQHGVRVTPTIRINGEIKSEGEYQNIDACKEILSEYL